jgi:preprotein translocase subunit YajC
MDDGSAALQNLIFFGVLLVGLYFLAIRPQRARAQGPRAVRGQMQVGPRSSRRPASTPP